MKEKSLKIPFILRKIAGIIVLLSILVSATFYYGYKGLGHELADGLNVCRMVYRTLFKPIFSDKWIALCICLLIALMVIIGLIVGMSKEKFSFLGSVTFCLFGLSLIVILAKGKTLDYLWTADLGKNVYHGKAFVVAIYSMCAASLLYTVFSSIYVINDSANVLIMNETKKVEQPETVKTEVVKEKKPAIQVNGALELGNEIQILAYTHEAYAIVTEVDGESMEFIPAHPEDSVNEVVEDNKEEVEEQPVDEVQEEKVTFMEEKVTFMEEPMAEETVEAPQEEELVEDEEQVNFFENISEEPVGEDANDDFVDESAPVEENVASFDEEKEEVVEETPAEEKVEFMPEQPQEEEAFVKEERVLFMPEEEDEFVEDEQDDFEDEDDDEEFVDDEQDNNPSIDTRFEGAKKSNFDEKILNATDELKDRYNQIKNAIMSYKNVRNRLSRTGDSFRYKGQKYVHIAIVGKTLRVYIALDPNSLDQSVYHHQDASNKKKYQSTPTLLKVKSNLSVKKAIMLIEAMFDESMIEKRKKYEEKDYAKELVEIAQNRINAQQSLEEPIEM